MRVALRTLVLSLFLILGNALYSQTISINDSIDVLTIAKDSLFSKCATVSNITHTGHPASIGYFCSSGSSFDTILYSGLILTTGYVNDAAGPNNLWFTESSLGTPGDPMLTALLQNNWTYDASIVEFEVIPSTDTLEFTFVFASEVYPTWYSQWNEGFAIFITGPNPSGGNYNNENIAVAPGTVIPISTFSINPTTNSQYYISNGSISAPYDEPIEYNGYTVRLKANTAVDPCSSYDVKISIADKGNAAYDDSAVLLGFNSTSQTPPLVQLYSVVPVETSEGEITEGKAISYVYTRVDSSNISNPVYVTVDQNGNAIEGYDYQIMPDTLWLQPGQLSDTLEILTLLNPEEEPNKEIVLRFTSNCSSYKAILIDTIVISDLYSRSQYINLIEGWSYFSTYLRTLEPSLDSVFQEIFDDLIIIKDGNGNIYMPQWGINLIDTLSIYEGYQVKVDSCSLLAIEGIPVNKDTVKLILNQGWSIIGYLNQFVAPIDYVLDAILPSVYIVKDQDGVVFWPQYGVSLLSELKPGQGYHIKMSMLDTLVYPSSLDSLYECPPTITDYDGNNYSTVQIGDQCWMRENLRTQHYENGTSIPYVSAGWGVLLSTDLAYCYPGYDTSNALVYGALYNWATISFDTVASVNPEYTQGICPQGWHIPGVLEWNRLSGYVDSQYDYPDPEWDDTWYRGYDAGLKLKSSNLWNQGNNGTDEYNLTIVPSGAIYANGMFTPFAGLEGYYWTSSQYSTSEAWFIYFDHLQDGIGKITNYKRAGFSVRCLKD